MAAPSPADFALTQDEKDLLLKIARKGLVAAVQGHAEEPSIDELPDRLQSPLACFITLKSHGDLRGCTGTLEARQPLAVEVFKSTIQTARRDPRFEPVSSEELDDIALSISILTTPQPLAYESPADLIAKLRPGVDGVTLAYGIQRGTFLPQVWDKVPDPVDFLSRLCEKMGLPRSWWMSNRMEVEVYQAVEVSEPDYEA